MQAAKEADATAPPAVFDPAQGRANRGNRQAGLRRAFFASPKADYLAALTQELDHPRDRILDACLGDLIIDSRPPDDWVEYFRNIPGLSGLGEDEEHVAHGDNDPDAWLAMRRLNARGDLVRNQKIQKSTAVRSSLDRRDCNAWAS